MKKKTLLAALLCMFLAPILFAEEAKAVDYGWVVCETIRIGSNAQHGFAYLELTSAGPHAGIFNNVIFQIDDSIRKEALAVALTSLSLKEYIRVLVTNEVNSRGYQIVKAVYTYVP